MPIIHKYQKKTSFSQKNEINNFKFPSIFKNQLIKEKINKDKQKNKFMLFFLSRNLGNNSKILNKILDERKTNIIFRNYFHNYLNIKTLNGKINDNFMKRKIKNYSSENIFNKNRNENFSLDKIVLKKLKIKKNNSTTLFI